MKPKIKFLFLLFAISAISCKTAEFGYQVIDVNGMVYDFSNRPVPFCEITLGAGHKSVTDINGRFTLQKVPAGTYLITGFKNGYEFHSDEINIRDAGQIVYIRMPSARQLLNLADQALTANNTELAGEMIGRALLADSRNTEALFYSAVLKFRQRDYSGAVEILDGVRNSGVRDFYVDKFFSDLKELVHENND